MDSKHRKNKRSPEPQKILLIESSFSESIDNLTLTDEKSTNETFPNENSPSEDSLNEFEWPLSNKTPQKSQSMHVSVKKCIQCKQKFMAGK